MGSKQFKGYELIEERWIEDVKSRGYYLRHKKSGARIAVLSNDDENKVFSIAFRTPPKDSTGLPHILEHSVLCGSKKYPVKDPFIELTKGSLNTFLNAMTYPDKTVYPVASCNDKDFQNLMSVYMDAVFYPNIYAREEIFRQEGWHYELEDVDAPIQINGVVYNEMKGAFSNPEGILEREIMSQLYPDVEYANESGGDPKCIPTLRHEDFLAFHEKYYHPSNSYVYLYGDMDVEEKLEWLDREYLSRFDVRTIDSAIGMQAPFEELRSMQDFYPVSEEEPLEDNTYLSYCKSIGEGADKKLAITFSVLDYALLSAPGAPLRKNLLREGIGKDILGYFEDDVQQPYFTVISKNANGEQKEAFLQVIQDTLREVVEQGVNQKSVEAALNTMEFKFREADYGNYPKGLMYGLQMFSSWLYREDLPFTMLEPLSVYEELRNLNGTGYFEDVIRNYLLDNTHGVCLVLEPKRGLNGENERQLEESLAEKKASMTREELEELVRSTKALKDYQQEPSPEEDLAKIPMLQVSDVRREITPLSNQLRQVDGVDVLYHPVETNGIAYLKLFFDMDGLDREEIQYASLLKAVLSYMDTDKHTYDDLSNEININSGGIGFALKYYENVKGDDKRKLAVGGKALYSQLPFVFDVIWEVIDGTDYSDDQRFQEIVAEIRSKLQLQVQSSGHVAASVRGMAYFSNSAAFQDYVDGVGFYGFIRDLEDHFQERKEHARDMLRQTARKLFVRSGLFVDVTADEEGYQAMVPCLKAFLAKLSEETFERRNESLLLGRRNEGFKMASQVQYVARCGNFAQKGLEYTGYLKVLQKIMSYDYLWNQVRVLGGAYGCMNSYRRNGDAYFVSYRDPNLAKTNEVYEKAAGYVANAEFDQREMTKFIIGTISGLDTPLTPSSRGARSLAAYMQGVTEDVLQKERDEILGADLQKIRQTAKYIEAFLEDDCLCVFGNESVIEENAEAFLHVETI